MSVPGWIMLNIYVAIIAVILLSITVSGGAYTRQDRSFVFMLSVILVLLTADSLSKLYLPGPVGLWVKRAGTYLIFSGDPVGYLASLIYIDSWTSGRKDRAERFLYGVVYGYVFLNLTLVTVSALFDLRWFYDYHGYMYSRGSLFVARGVLNMGFCAIISLYIFLRRSQIRTNYKVVVVFFPLIILASGFLQVFVGGASYEYAGSVLACLLLFLKVQAHNIDDDYLTGLLNRRGFVRELEYQCSHYHQDHPFLVYLIDLDFFKQINDISGHQTGDEALIRLSGLLRDTFGRNAKIGRYGGDEFVVLSFDHDAQQAEKRLEELRNRCDDFNHLGARTYRLSFSAGYAFYSPEIYPEVEQFFHHIDHLMYREKESHHALRVAEKHQTEEYNVP